MTKPEMVSRSIPQVIRAINGRSVTGIWSVLGNKDEYETIFMPGCFTKTISERRTKIRFIWGHSWAQPPTAIIEDIREIGLSELPDEVLKYAPDALSAMQVTRRYTNNPFGDWLIDYFGQGGMLDMSHWSGVVKADQDNGIPLFRECKLFEISDVIVGGNEATTAMRAMPPELLLPQLEGFVAAVRAGARHSTADMALLKTIHDACRDLGYDCSTAQSDETPDESQRAAKQVAERVLDQFQTDQPGITAEEPAEAIDHEAASRAADALTRQRLTLRLRAAQQALALNPSFPRSASV